MKTIHVKADKTIPEVSTTISLIGLESMGAVLAEAFLKTGYSTTIWNPSDCKSGKHGVSGARFASTPSEAIDAGALVIISMKDNKTVFQLLETITGDFSEKTLLNLTNGTPEDSLKAAKYASKLGFKYLNAGSMILPPMIGSIG